MLRLLPATVAAAALTTASAPAPEPAHAFYVAPSGRDDQAGTLAAPFATLRRAQLAVRALKAAHGGAVPAGGVEVRLRGGVYAAGAGGAPLLELSAADSGSAEGAVTWRAHGGEPVLLSGGLEVPAAAFAPRRGSHGVLEANLTALGLHDLGAVGNDNVSRPELFFGGQPMELARWPNSGPDGRPTFASVGALSPPNCTTSCAGFVFSGESAVSAPPPHNLSGWVAERDVWLHGYWDWDFADGYMNVTRAAALNRTSAMLEVGGRLSKVGARFYALNLLSELDHKGEYYIGRQAGSARGMLYFMPPAAPSGMAGAAAGAFVSTANFVITLGANTSYVQFEGLRIEHSRGTAVAQPAMPGDPNWWPTNPLAASAGGRLHNISFRSCVVANAGGSGLSLDRCTGCSVHDSEVYGVGEAAILISGGHHRTLVRSENLVKNTSLHHFARWHRAGRPGLRWAGVGNSFIGNRIYEAPHQGVEGGGSSAKCGVCVRGRKGDLECEYTGNGTAPGMDDATCGANGKIVILSRIACCPSR